MRTTPTTPDPHDDGRPAVVIDVWFDAGVWSADTHIGTVGSLVCSAHAAHLHDVVIRDEDRPHDEYPIDARHITGARGRDLVVDVSPGVARARRIPTRTVMMTDDQTWWVEPGMGGSSDWLLYDEPLWVPVAVPRLRPGDVLVHRHAAVYVGGHHVGRLSGVQVDAATGRIGGAIVDVGHRWHHRHVVVPASDIEELSDLVVSLRGSRQQIRHMPPPVDADLDAVLAAVDPSDPVGERSPDSAHVEAAHLLADEAQDLLRGRGFTDEEIRHWADAFAAEQDSGDVRDFLQWIDSIEHGRRRISAPAGATADHAAEG